MSDRTRVLALSGGVGGAKLVLGLARVVAPEALTVVANTADDFEHLGLYIAPDLDTVMYTLAGMADRERGWGLAEESWRCMDALERLGGEAWFRLGDRDLATHLRRSQLLREGLSLSEVTAALCRSLRVETPLRPPGAGPPGSFAASLSRNFAAFLALRSALRHAPSASAAPRRCQVFATRASIRPGRCLKSSSC